MKKTSEKMTNNDCLKMFNALNAVKQPKFEEIRQLKDKDDYLFHVKFVHAISWNKRKLEKIVEDLREAEKFSEDYEEFLKKREEILIKHSKKDKDGNPMEKVEYGADGKPRKSYNIPGMNNKDSIPRKELDSFEKKNKAVIEARKKQEDELQEMMKEENDFVPKKVLWSQVPAGLSIEAMDGVMFMIEEDSDPVPVKKLEPKK